MKLKDVVQAIVKHEKVSAKDIEETVLLLTDESVLDDVRVLRRITKKLVADMKYEEAPMT
jgi:hypothetical protein